MKTLGEGSAWGACPGCRRDPERRGAPGRVWGCHPSQARATLPTPPPFGGREMGGRPARPTPPTRFCSPRRRARRAAASSQSRNFASLMETEPRASSLLPRPAAPISASRAPPAGRDLRCTQDHARLYCRTGWGLQGCQTVRFESRPRRTAPPELTAGGPPLPHSPPPTPRLPAPTPPFPGSFLPSPRPRRAPRDGGGERRCEGRKSGRSLRPPRPDRSKVRHRSSVPFILCAPSLPPPFAGEWGAYSARPRPAPPSPPPRPRRSAAVNRVLRAGCSGAGLGEGVMR